MIDTEYQMVESAFASCCAAIVFSNFFVLDGTNEIYHKWRPDFEEFFVEKLNANKHRMIIATLNNYQPNADEMLKAYGFKRTAYKKKPLHGSSTLALFHRDPDIEDKNIPNQKMFKKPKAEKTTKATLKYTVGTMSG